MARIARWGGWTSHEQENVPSEPQILPVQFPGFKPSISRRTFAEPRCAKIALEDLPHDMHIRDQLNIVRGLFGDGS